MNHLNLQPPNKNSMWLWNLKYKFNVTNETIIQWKIKQQLKMIGKFEISQYGDMKKWNNKNKIWVSKIFKGILIFCHNVTNFYIPLHNPILPYLRHKVNINLIKYQESLCVHMMMFFFPFFIITFVGIMDIPTSLYNKNIIVCL